MSHRDSDSLISIAGTPPEASDSQPYPSASHRWHAVRTRDPYANNAFYYGATTTSIYCRPTCPGRVARRSNINFFDSIAIATQHGYRSCKRCSPDLDVWDRDARGRELVSRAEVLIRDLSHRRENWTVREVAEQLGIGGAHLHRLSRKYLGRTPKSSKRQQAVSLIGINQQKHLMDVPLIDCGMVRPRHLSAGPSAVGSIDQTENFYPFTRFELNFDLDFFQNPCLPESRAIDSFDLSTSIPFADQIDFPGADEHWARWLST